MVIQYINISLDPSELLPDCWMMLTSLNNPTIYDWCLFPETSLADIRACWGAYAAWRPSTWWHFLRPAHSSPSSSILHTIQLSPPEPEPARNNSIDLINFITLIFFETSQAEFVARLESSVWLRIWLYIRILCERHMRLSILIPSDIYKKCFFLSSSSK